MLIGREDSPTRGVGTSTPCHEPMPAARTGQLLSIGHPRRNTVACDFKTFNQRTCSSSRDGSSRVGVAASAEILARWHGAGEICNQVSVWSLKREPGS